MKKNFDAAGTFANHPPKAPWPRSRDAIAAVVDAYLPPIMVEIESILPEEWRVTMRGPVDLDFEPMQKSGMLGALGLGIGDWSEEPLVIVSLERLGNGVVHAWIHAEMPGAKHDEVFFMKGNGSFDFKEIASTATWLIEGHIKRQRAMSDLATFEQYQALWSVPSGIDVH